MCTIHASKPCTIGDVVVYALSELEREQILSKVEDGHDCHNELPFWQKARGLGKDWSESIFSVPDGGTPKLYICSQSNTAWGMWSRMTSMDEDEGIRRDLSLFKPFCLTRRVSVIYETVFPFRPTFISLLPVNHHRQ
jgi:hypothetical protein